MSRAPSIAWSLVFGGRRTMLFQMLLHPGVGGRSEHCPAVYPRVESHQQ